MTTTTTDNHATTPSVSSTTANHTTATSTTRIANNKPPVWTRLNHKGIYHDNRRLLKHRAKNCECHICYREIYKLPPAESQDEYIVRLISKKAERDIKQAKKKAKREVKLGKQQTIDNFFVASL